MSIIVKQMKTPLNGRVKNSVLAFPFFYELQGKTRYAGAELTLQIILDVFASWVGC